MAGSAVALLCLYGRRSVTLSPSPLPRRETSGRRAGGWVCCGGTMPVWTAECDPIPLPLPPQGDIWAESRWLGLLWRYYACMDGGV